MSKYASRHVRGLFGTVLGILIVSGCTRASLINGGVKQGPGNRAPASNGSSISALSIGWSSRTLVVADSKAVVPTGGVPPYSYSVVSGAGSFSGATFVAPGIPGTTTIQVSDSQGTQVTASITINAALAISPATLTLAEGDSYAFSATGGVSPYSYSVVSAGGGSFSGATYTAPASPGSYTVQVADSLGHTSQATVTVNAALSISPVTPDVQVNATQAFSATGGVSPYTYSVVTAGGGSFSGATYTAPATPGSYTVKVTDNIGNTSSTIVNAYSALAISPTAPDVQVNATKSFGASGGVSPYSYSVVTAGGGSFSGATYTAPATAGSYTVKVTDNVGNTSTTTVNVYNALAISPTTPDVQVSATQAFSATGGVSPYTYSVVTAGGGSFSGATYTAAATPGSYTVKVTDNVGNTNTTVVSVYAALAISPTTVTLGVGNTQAFSATGGGSPYTYSVVTTGGGSFSGATYTAPASSGTYTVEVTDNVGNTSQATVTVNPALAISPSSKTLMVGNTFTFTASGGSGTGYTYSISSGAGSINSSTGAYTAPGSSGSATVEVTDSLGNTSQASLTINPQLTISPTTRTLVVNQTYSAFTASGGVPALAFSTTGNGSINSSTGVYTAPSTSGTDGAKVTDSLGNNVTATITVLKPTQIAAGHNFSCGLLSDGTAQCWGSNSNDDLGDGTSTDRWTPTYISGLTGASSIAKFNGLSDHGCVLLSSGGVDCWGYNYFGELGNNSTTSSATPVSVSGISTAIQVAVGGNHSCAILSGGSVKCWGNNTYGQLGNNSTTQSSVPVSVTGLSGAATALALGYQHSCAIVGTGTVQCWGYGGDGELGNGGTTQALTPVSVSGITTANQITAGGYHSCAVLSGGTTQCWGSNSAGQLGNNSNTNSSVPVTVSGMSSPVAIAAGSTHTCAITSTNDVKCWGDNGYGEIGNNSVSTVSKPYTVSGISTATAAAGGWQSMCVLLSSGSIDCFGDNDYGQIGNGTSGGTASTPTPVAGISTASQVSAGSYFGCALLSDKTVKCWGANESGELGNNSTVASSTPVSVSGITTATGVSSAAFHTCAVLSGGGVQCWGFNGNGELGDNSTTTSSVPVNVSGISTATQVGSGRSGSCALLSSGAVDCWGYGGYGGLGNGATADSWTPVTVSGISTATSIAVGFYHACALLSGGTVKCWGDNDHGQLGNNSTTQANTPVSVTLGGTVTALTAGDYFTCALLSSGAMQCWGDDYYGQLGNGTSGVIYKTPQSVNNVSSAIVIGHGEIEACAVISGGGLQCWGDNTRGSAVGNGSAGPYLTPLLTGPWTQY